ncbi:hypothetical protein CDAR_250631 [Caerostris darwini]|uniref:Uncharacterized protein n=1 Tax=Caerostris darwini TaxID=1538125 RepID=A0AAV4RV79_9ARAC|nr:hypothetical protein CDAR_250631 [Caerostris darwini]
MGVQILHKRTPLCEDLPMFSFTRTATLGVTTSLLARYRGTRHSTNTRPMFDEQGVMRAVRKRGRGGHVRGRMMHSERLQLNLDGGPCFPVRWSVGHDETRIK